MTKKKQAAREGSEEEKTEEETQEQTEEQAEARKARLKSMLGIMNTKVAALAIAALIVGILVGQMALPGLGVGLITLPVGSTAIDTAALQAKVQDYITENLSTEGATLTVESLEEISEGLFLANIEFEKDGQTAPVEAYVTKDGTVMLAGQITAFMLNEPVEQLEPDPQQQPPTDEPPVVRTFETFKDSGYDIETEDGKPVIRLFSTTWCPHCEWVKETFDSTVKEYVDAGKIVAHHWEVDTFDDTITPEAETSVPESEMAAYSHFNPGGSIPTFILGGRYYRVGNGFEGPGDTANPTTEQSLANLAAEEAALRAVIESLIEEAGQ